MKTPQIIDIRDSITQAGIQNVDLASTISVPYTTITNRANIPNLASDLKVRFGVDRIMTQSIYPLQNEFGPNGEPVYGVVNDTFGQIRVVGGFSTTFNPFGQYIVSTINSTTDFVEITFYGTGLNVLSQIAATTRSWSVSVDGGSASTVVVSNPSGSGILNGRNYSNNQVVNLVSGLALGIHTVKISLLSAASDYITFFGFEILNTSSALVVNPGSMLSDGKRIKLSSQQTPAYASGFTNTYGTAGSRGGRVLVYMDKDGTIKKDIQYVDTAPAYLASASHTNEEVVRTHFPREFGAGRTDDFSTVAGSGSSRAFTLDDGTTTLVVQNTNINDRFAVGYECLSATATSDFITLTFVGTGLDITVLASSISSTFAVTIDGSSAGSLTFSSANIKSVRKICSGLPYGTHTVRFAWTVNAVGITAFTIYGPKKPSLPSGAVELADYNVMADFIANATAGLDNIATGVLRKNCLREIVYVNGTGGTSDWTVDTINAITYPGGWLTFSDRQNAYFEYTFFGTGFEARMLSGSNKSANISVLINGLAATTANYVTLVSSVYGVGVTFTSGTLDINDATANGAVGLRISGLPLAKYTIRFNNNSSGSFVNLNNIDIITPIHSPRSNLYADAQNTLPVGSCSISDNRKTTYLPITSQKAIAQAVGVVSSPTITGTVIAPVPDMSVTIKTSGGQLDISFSGVALVSNAGNATTWYVYIDGVAISAIPSTYVASITVNQYCSSRLIWPVSAGVHKVDIYWTSGAAGVTSTHGNTRFLVVKEV